MAAGLGTRLRPITNDTPKCLVPINGRPLLDIWVETLVCSGVKEILVNAHYLHNQVKEYVNNSKYKNLILIQYEEELLGTAGTLIKNSSFLEDEGGLLIHADNFSDGTMLTKYNGVTLAEVNVHLMGQPC